jgi:hypothetical protein
MPAGLELKCRRGQTLVSGALKKRRRTREGLTMRALIAMECI